MTKQQNASIATHPQLGVSRNDASPGIDLSGRSFKRGGQSIAPATPANWSRYINSRLKQFGTR
jgi:hypothetical protein